MLQLICQDNKQILYYNKDGRYPTNVKHLGRKINVGEGFANIPEIVKRLREVGYTGNYVIECEINGD